MSNFLCKTIEEYFLDSVGDSHSVNFKHSISGGSIHQAALIECNQQPYFVKYSSRDNSLDMFEKEKRGLELLRSSEVSNIPQSFQCGSKNGLAFLMLEYLEQGSENPNSFSNFGKQLALLHRNTNHSFGLDHSNYIGSLEQENTFTKSWKEFFFLYRLEPMIKMATDSRHIDRPLRKAFEHFTHRIDELFPNEKPALLHGDLWQGNFLFDKKGDAHIFDPAVYYGHREMDLAMSKLFGGFSESFYHTYHQQFPLEKGWKERIDFCNLYPLLVHLNLFGAGYLGEIKSILKHF